ncbi:hypothetical protein VNI00_017420 [Paramarasmius palmivorus]|uniref:Uncharacterized protein n=1 Tax=Paramarasmius palmivorus TaxID=297713 RepID=A0AAW0B627_9AGAR
MASCSNPAVLGHIRSMLNVEHPSGHAASSVVVAHCCRLLAVLEAFDTYLRSVGPSTAVEFPGEDGEASWKLLRRTFVVLEIWSPLFRPVVNRPPVLETPGWLNEVVRVVFGLIYVVLEYHGDSALCNAFLRSEDAMVMCLRVFYEVLAVDGSVLRHIVAVIIHPNWPSGTFQGERSRLILGSVTRSHPEVDFPRSTVLRFVHLLRPSRVLQDAPELHGIAVALMHLKESTLRFMQLRLPHWLASCALYTTNRLRRALRGGDVANLQFDVDMVGLLLLLCVEYLDTVSRSFGSSGWVLDAVRGGIVRAVLDIGAYVEVENVKAADVYYGRLGTELERVCDVFLQSLLPHLLSPGILCAVKKVLNHRGPQNPTSPVGWGSWADVVAQVCEIYFGYKVSEYRKETKWTCSNETCPRDLSDKLLRLQGEAPVSVI